MMSYEHDLLHLAVECLHFSTFVTSFAEIYKYLFVFINYDIHIVWNQFKFVLELLWGLFFSLIIFHSRLIFFLIDDFFPNLIYSIHSALKLHYEIYTQPNTI